MPRKAAASSSTAPAAAISAATERTGRARSIARSATPLTAPALQVPNQ
ncbi:hypothetical protein ABZ800_21010 [Streptomyces sp. NPDC047813]